MKVAPVAAVWKQEVPAKFVPVRLPGDRERGGLLARSESLSAEELAITVSRPRWRFWASKTGQHLIRDRVKRNFPEFIGSSSVLLPLNIHKTLI